MLRSVRCLLIILGLISISAHATLELELTQGVDSAVPIAILPFAGQSAIADGKITDVISNDLRNSGRFRSVAPSVDSANPQAMNYDYWRSQKIDAVVLGQMQAQGGDQVSVEFKLLDNYNKNVLLVKDFKVKRAQLRSLAHHISDLVYQQLTGDRGVFSTKIAYILVHRQPGQATKYKFEVADADGFNPQTLLVSSHPLMSPTWSPDGRQVAYVTFEGNRAAICVQDVITGQRKLITKYPGINGAPAWSPDGSKMAVVLTQTGYPKIYVLDIASGSLQRITDDWYLDTEPSWAPDGQSIIFTSNRGGSSPQIYRVYLGSKKVERVTFKGRYNARASFTPDAKGIVMLHQDDTGFNIAYQDLHSGRHTVLTRSGFDESPSIAPNGKMIVYATNYRGGGVLAEVSIDGKVKLLLPARQGAVQEPAWSPFKK